MEGALDGAWEEVGTMVVSCGVGAGMGVVVVGSFVGGGSITGGSVSDSDGAFVGGVDGAGVGSGTITADGSLVISMEVGNEDDEGMIAGDVVGCPTLVEVNEGEVVGVATGEAV